MKVLVTRGTLSRKHGSDGKDIGFAVLFPGEYAGCLCVSGDLEINMSDGKYAYLSIRKVEEKLLRGDIVLLEAQPSISKKQCDE